MLLPICLVEGLEQSSISTARNTTNGKDDERKELSYLTWFTAISSFVGFRNWTDTEELVVIIHKTLPVVFTWIGIIARINYQIIKNRSEIV